MHGDRGQIWRYYMTAAKVYFKSLHWLDNKTEVVMPDQDLEVSDAGGLTWSGDNNEVGLHRANKP